MTDFLIFSHSIILLIDRIKSVVTAGSWCLAAPHADSHFADNHFADSPSVDTPSADIPAGRTMRELRMAEATDCSAALYHLDRLASETSLVAKIPVAWCPVASQNY